MKNGAIAILSISAFALVTSLSTAHAASGPQAFVTWTAVGGSTAPANYAGKVLPTKGTPITADVSVIANGVPANLSGRTIYWYLDDNFLGGGIGQQSITFNAPGVQEIMTLRADITDYPAGEINYAVHIPVAVPQIVIVSPYANGAFSGSSAEVSAVPYYFPVSDLSKLVLSWTVNGQAVTSQENPEDLTINIDPGTPLGYAFIVSLGATLSDQPLVNTQAGITLTKAQ